MYIKKRWDFQTHTPLPGAPWEVGEHPGSALSGHERAWMATPESRSDQEGLLQFPTAPSPSSRAAPALPLTQLGSGAAPQPLVSLSTLQRITNPRGSRQKKNNPKTTGFQE